MRRRSERREAVVFSCLPEEMKNRPEVLHRSCCEAVFHNQHGLVVLWLAPPTHPSARPFNQAATLAPP